MPESTKIQAMVPEGSLVLLNAHGTAPGLVMEAPADKSRATPTLLSMLPGPPRELRPMFVEQVVPLLKEKLPGTANSSAARSAPPASASRAWKKSLRPSSNTLTDAGLELGYCARIGEVDVRLVARGCGALRNVTKAESIAREAIGDTVRNRRRQLETRSPSVDRNKNDLWRSRNPAPVATSPIALPMCPEHRRCCGAVS